MSDIGPEVRIWAFPVVSVLVIIGAIGWATIGWWFGIIPLAAALFAIMALVVAGHPRVRTRRQERQDAERLTAQLLRPLESRGHRILRGHPAPDNRTRVNHLVVGPTGVYALSSRKWHRRIPVRTMYQNLFHGPESQRKLLDDTAAEANRTENLISDWLRQPIPVTPAVVIHGPRVPWTVLRLRGVDVLSSKRLRRYIDRRDRRLSTVEVERITAATEEALAPKPTRSKTTR